ncbi:hypothetical protein IU459_32650 [Nocardia amamiensis]|uniref:Recombinase A n=1 Tax=Nocardia amamiensis TaxID=404578 RepID=A0ABS0D1G2_9NOCA|nr:hypothetical protein [Nocardia amamiensis]MBF6302255.1 hypothetical protein [Nocardia amamiensis]
MFDDADVVTLTGLPRDQQLAELRARMAAIPGRIGATEPPPLLARSSTAVIPVAGGLGEALPEGGLPRGGVVACTGRRTPLVGLLAAVTAAGEWVAVVGQPQLGLLAFTEMNGDLTKLAHIPDLKGEDPLTVAAVLLDGVDVVVLDVAGGAPPSRMRAVLARLRSHDGVLVVTGAGWARPDLEIRCELAEYDGLSRGRGRLQTMTFDIQVTGRTARRPRTTRVQLAGTSTQRCSWTRRAPVAAVAPASIARTG